MLFNQPISNTLRPFDRAVDAEFAQRFAPLGADAANFLSALGPISAHLSHLLNAQGEWLLEHCHRPFEQALAQAMTFEGAVDIGLRCAKQRVALVVALADLAGISDLTTLTTALSDFADIAIEQALRDAIRDADLPAQTLGADGFGGIFCLAMGKLGARELNYSSDIDLIFFFDDHAHPAAQVGALRAQFSKIVRRTVQTLSTQTGDGYVFRTDLRLRPNPSVTPVCQSVSSARHYYLKEGRSWERAAFIKARVCAGNRHAGQNFLKTQRPFIWRAALDYAAMKDVSALLDQARNHRGLTNNSTDLSGYDLKLGRGGIREIEFFTQTRQLIFGGRNPALRDRATSKSLCALANAGQIAPDTAQSLIARYTYLRMLEHRIQMLRDQQTHSLPRNDEDYGKLLALMGHQDRKEFETDLRTQLLHTCELTRPAASAAPAQALPDTPPIDFSAFETLPALRHDTARALFAQLKPVLSTLIASAPNQDAALQSLRQYMGALREGVAPLSLLHERPDVLHDLFHLLCLSQPIAVELAQRMPQIYDMVESGVLKRMPSLAHYRGALRQRLATQSDYETQLISMRSWAAEQKFQIKFVQLRRELPIEKAERAYSNIAQACLGEVLRLVQDQIHHKYGRLSKARLALIAMGKLGSGEMTATSDLDLILVYDAPADARAGPKAIDAKQYFTHFTRALITALSAPMAYGPLYEVDMRLRPSGRAGTVATQIDSFAQYQHQKAWVWEHQALSRARVIVGDARLRRDVDHIRAQIMNRIHSPKTLQQEAREMRKRLDADFSDAQSALSVKKGLGGMLDVDLLAQNYALMGASEARRPMAQLADAKGAGLIDPKAYGVITQHYARFKLVDHYLRQLGETARDDASLNHAGRALLAQRSGLTYDALLAQLADGRRALADCITQCVNRFGRA